MAEESKYSVAMQDDEEDEMAAFKGRQLHVGDNQSDDDLNNDEDYHDADFDDSKTGSRMARADNVDWQEKFRQLESEHREQGKTINFQKAKIAAL